MNQSKAGEVKPLLGVTTAVYARPGSASYGIVDKQRPGGYDCRDDVLLALRGGNAVKLLSLLYSRHPGREKHPSVGTM